MSRKNINKSLLGRTSWRNRDNRQFYEQIKVDGMLHFARSAGLTTGCDVDRLIPLLEPEKAILEIGAGYGRVIHFLLKKITASSITAIEKDQLYCDYLKKLYGDSIQLLQMDACDCKIIAQKFDVILFLWSGIADYAANEQKKLICDLIHLLNNKGKLIVDTLPENTTPLGMTKNGNQKVYTQCFNNSVIHTYNISIKEIEAYAKTAGFSSIQHTSYTTDTKRERLFHILEK